jgi:predicted peptidase
MNLQKPVRGSIPVLVAALACLAYAATRPANKPKQIAATFESKIHVRVNYLLYLPPDYATEEKLPLLVFLHGAGACDDNLDMVKRDGLPKLIEQGKTFPFIIVSPQCGKDQWWTAEQRELTALIDEIVAKYKVDPERIYLTGLSMGGFGTWSLAAYAPDRFAAIIPICGGGTPNVARLLEKTPVWAFHGGKDPIVPVTQSQEMIDAIKKAGGEAKLTIYPDAGHDSWTATYANPEIYEWLLAHKRPIHARVAIPSISKGHEREEMIGLPLRGRAL